jgi:hypothetical protein
MGGMDVDYSEPWWWTTFKSEDAITKARSIVPLCLLVVLLVKILGPWK